MNARLADIGQDWADLAAEDASIKAAIAARQIGDGYWHTRHKLETQLRAALALRNAINEVQS